jgi:ATP synthase protein I
MGDDDRLAKLDKRIEALRGGKADETSRTGERYSQAEVAWRMVIEMVSGLMVGFAMGYGLDTLFGTMPIFLVTFTLLGIAAGIRLMMRSAAQLQRSGADAEEARTGDRDGEG